MLNVASITIAGKVTGELIDLDKQVAFTIVRRRKAVTGEYVFDNFYCKIDKARAQHLIDNYYDGANLFIMGVPEFNQYLSSKGKTFAQFEVDVLSFNFCSSRKRDAQEADE